MGLISTASAMLSICLKMTLGTCVLVFLDVCPELLESSQGEGSKYIVQLSLNYDFQECGPSV